MDIDFYYPFKRFQTEDQEREEAERLVDILLEPKGFNKLRVGADGLSSAYLPTVFIEVFLRELIARNTRVKELVIDLEFLNKLVKPSQPQTTKADEEVSQAAHMSAKPVCMREITDRTSFLAAVGDTLA